MARLLPRIPGDGPTQMAIDEALLEWAETTTVRVYGWAPPAVSLGYFQDHAAIAAQLQACGAGDMDIVRRITGGGAIWHEHEVTYCVVARLGGKGLPERVRDIYPLLHGAVAGALRARTISVARQTETRGDRRYAVEPRCFASPAQDDLVAGHGKMLGSAARTRGARILVHGSLKLASNRWDAEAVTGCGLGWLEAADLLEAALAGALGETLVGGQLSPDEEAAAARIRTERYGDSAWVRERRGPRP